MRRIIRLLVYLAISLGILSLGIVFTYGIKNNTKKAGDLYSDQYSISYTVNSDGSVNVREMISVQNGQEDFEDLFLPINYVKDNSLSKNDDQINFDYSSFNMVLQSAGQEYAYNYAEKGFVQNYFISAFSWDSDYNTTVKGEELKTTKGSSMAYLHCNGGFPAYFSLTITYKLYNFVTVFNDYSYLQTSARAFEYPYTSMYFTIALPGTDESVTIDDVKLSTTRVFKGFVTHPSKSGFVIKGDGLFNSTFESKVVFPSSAMKSIDSYEDTQTNYINSEVGKGIYKKIAYYEGFDINVAILVGTISLSVLALLLIVYSMIFRKKKTGYLNMDSTEFLAFTRANRISFVKDLLIYYMFKTKSVVPYLNGDTLMLKASNVEDANELEKYVISQLNPNISYEDAVKKLSKNIGNIKKIRKHCLKNSNGESAYLNPKTIDMFFLIPAIIYALIGIALIFLAKPIFFCSIFAVAVVLMYFSKIDETFIFTPFNGFEQFSKSSRKIDEYSKLEHAEIPQFKEIEPLLINSHLGKYNLKLYEFINKNNKDKLYLKNCSITSNQKIIKTILE